MALTHQEPEYLTGHTDGVFGGHEPVVLDVAEDYVRVPNGDFLLSAEYSQFGPDLSLSGDGIEVLVKDYFTFETAPDLLNADGTSVIGGALALKLAGPITPGQFAQLAQGVSVPSVGVIESLEGAVQLTRTDGSTVQAEKGSKVFVGDIVKTEANANVGIKFVDDTSFALGESGRLVIDELIYDPSGNSGQSSFSVVNGVFSFVSGQIAKVGDDAMQVTTPVATIGIRGTTVAGKAAAEGSANTITLLPDAGGGVGQIAVSNSAGTQIMSVPFQTTSLSSAFTAPPVPVVLPANQLQNLYGKIQNVLPPTTNTQQQQQNKSDDEAGPAAKGDAEEGSGEKEGEKKGEAGEGEGENTEQQGEGVEEEGEGQPGEGEVPPEGEGQPGEGEAPPEGEGRPGEGEAPPESEGQPGEGEAPPEGEGQPGEGEAPPEGEGRPGEGEGQPGEGEASPGEGERSPGEGVAPPEEGERPPDEGAVTPEAKEPAEQHSGSSEGAQQSDNQDENNSRQENETEQPDRYENARDAFDEARSGGLSEAQAFEKAASAIGTTDEEKQLAEAVYQKALDEGADPREAMFQAEDAVRDEFDQNRNYSPLIGETGKALEAAIAKGASAEDAIKQQISGPNVTQQDIRIVEEAAFRSLDNVFQSNDASGLAFILESTGSSGSLGENTFREALLSGASIDEAFGAAFEANLNANARNNSGVEDFIAADIFLQGFDPGLRASSLILETIQEAAIQTFASEGTIADFTEIINLTDANDNAISSLNSDTSFFATQGVSLNGIDRIDGVDGTDELTINNLSDILLIGNFVSPVNAIQTFFYSTEDGNLTGSIGAENIDQFFFGDSSGFNQRLTIPDGGGQGAVIVGDDGNDILNINGDGTAAPELTFGTLTLDVDSQEFFGAILFGGNGADQITSPNRPDIQMLLFGGNGNDIINATTADEIIQAGPGDDTIVVSSPDGLISTISDLGTDDISGGTNGSQGDTLQIGTSSTQTGLTFIQQNDDVFVGISGFENLDVFTSNTIFQGSNEIFVALNNITTTSGATDVTLKSFGNVLNLSTTNVSSGISRLEANADDFGGGVTLIDASDNIGRTLVGTADIDTLSGIGGNDIFLMGLGRDVLSGGAGDDSFVINTGQDISDGLFLSGGDGTDRLVVNSTEITNLSFPINTTSFATLEIIDLSGGSTEGVSMTIAGRQINLIPQLIGNGTADILNVFSDDYDARDVTTNGIEQINLTQTVNSDPVLPNRTGQTLLLDGGSSNISGLKSFNATANPNNETDDSIEIFNEFDFSGIEINNFQEVILRSGDTDLTIGADETTRFNGTKIRFFEFGNGPTPDIFDYKSDLVGGNGTTSGNAASDTLLLNNVTTKSVDFITSSSSAVIDIEFSELPIDLSTASENEIVAQVKSLLESSNQLTNLTGTANPVSQGNDGTDALLILYEENLPGRDGVIMKYKETDGDASFDNELSVFAIFEDVGESITFANGNIV